MIALLQITYDVITFFMVILAAIFMSISYNKASKDVKLCLKWFIVAMFFMAGYKIFDIANNYFKMESLELIGNSLFVISMINMLVASINIYKQGYLKINR